MLVKHVPIWFPGAAFKRQAMEWRRSTTAMVEVPFKAVKKAIVSQYETFSVSVVRRSLTTVKSEGIASPSMILSLLSDVEDSDGKSQLEELYSGVAAAAYTGKIRVHFHSISRAYLRL